MKRINKIIFWNLYTGLAVYGAVKAVEESYTVSLQFLKVNKVLTEKVDVNELVKVHSYLNDLNPAYVKAHIKTEHRCKQNDLNKCDLTRSSKKGARGAMQIMRSTAELYKVDYNLLDDVNKNIELGTKILKDNLVRRNDAVKATKEYNGGGRSLKINFKETEEYQRLVFLDLATNFER